MSTLSVLLIDRVRFLQLKLKKRNNGISAENSDIFVLKHRFPLDVKADYVLTNWKR